MLSPLLLTALVTLGARPHMPPSVPEPVPATRRQLLDSGRVLFRTCAVCHGEDGRGGRGPAVANSDYVQGDRARLIATVLAGVHEPIRVNGVRWNFGEMSAWGEVWDDFRVAAVLTWIRSALNDSTVVSCIDEDVETGTWASCELKPRTAEEMHADTIPVAEVTALRALMNLPSPQSGR